MSKKIKNPSDVKKQTLKNLMTSEVKKLLRYNFNWQIQCQKRGRMIFQ